MKSFEITKTLEYDVIVVGGGTTGIAAAIASARSGKKTAIIELQGFLGGTSANMPCWMGFHDMDGEFVVAGIAKELATELQKAGEATDYYLDPITSSVMGVNSNYWKLLAVQVCRDAGVDMLMTAMFVDVEMDKSCRKVTGIYIQTRAGLYLYKASNFVDSTDAGDVLRKAGVPMIFGREEDHKTQVSSWVFTLSGVDFSKIFDHFKNHPEDMRPWVLEDPAPLLSQMEQAESFVMGSFKSIVAQAQAEGLEIPRDNLPGIAFPQNGEIKSVAVRVESVDPSDPESLTAAEEEGMRQTKLYLDFFRKYVPGCEKCRLTETPNIIGIRETYHYNGEYVLDYDDLLAGKVFDDAIAVGGYHLDYHTPDDKSSGELHHTPRYTIPYRSLMPKELDNVLSAGRIYSSTYLAMASTRVIPIGMAMGEAAGLASAMAVECRGNVRDVSMNDLQQELIERGVILK